MCEFPLCFPPYNIRCMPDEDSLINQLWASTDMISIETVFREVLCSVSSGHLFCSGLQIGVWNAVWSNDVREQDDARQSRSCSEGKSRKNDRTIFEVEWILLLHESCVERKAAHLRLAFYNMRVLQIRQPISVKVLRPEKKSGSTD